MQLTQSDLEQFASYVVNETIKVLENRHYIKNPNEKSAYAKTETLLYNYLGFKKIVSERLQEIENIKKYGVPKKSKDITKFSGAGGFVQGTVLEEDTVQDAVQTVQDSIKRMEYAIDLIENNMKALKYDPYYDILPMLYFDGSTQEEIATKFMCTQQAISYNKNRLVKQLAIRLFPEQSVNEMLS